LAATSGLRSSATAAAKKVTGMSALSKIRKSRQIPARDPYSYIDSTARSRWPSTSKGSS
jgi:hypothetical protein